MTEPTVRVWWLGTGLMAVTAICFAGYQLSVRMQAAHLIRDGVRVTGTIKGYELKRAAGQHVDPAADIMMGYSGPGGRDIEGVGQLQTESQVGAKINIRYDPADPSVWTDRTVPPSWKDALLSSALLLPLVVVMAGIAWLKTLAMRKTWVTAPAWMATVSEVRQTPVAPLSWAIRCSLRDGTDRRIYVVHAPRTAVTVDKGSPLWVLTPNSGRPVAVAWFGS